MSPLNRTIDSVGWTTLARVCQQGFQFGLSLLLMRQFGPTTFGLIGMVLVFSGFAAILSELGFSTALIQRNNLLEVHRSAANGRIPANHQRCRRRLGRAKRRVERTSEVQKHVPNAGPSFPMVGRSC